MTSAARNRGIALYQELCFFSNRMENSNFLLALRNKMLRRRINRQGSQDSLRELDMSPSCAWRVTARWQIPPGESIYHVGKGNEEIQNKFFAMFLM